jgi:hypothetical protein
MACTSRVGHGAQSVLQARRLHCLLPFSASVAVGIAAVPLGGGGGAGFEYQAARVINRVGKICALLGCYAAFRDNVSVLSSFDAASYPGPAQISSILRRNPEIINQVLRGFSWSLPRPSFHIVLNAPFMPNIHAVQPALLTVFVYAARLHPAQYRLTVARSVPEGHTAAS